MKKLALAVIAAAALVAVLSVEHFDGLNMQVGPEYLQVSVFDKYRSVAIIGESYRPSWLERQVLFREDNAGSRERIFDLLKKEGPSLIVFLGNMVARGASSGDWLKFDQLVNHFLAARTPMLAVPGEREYAGLDRTAAENLESRFPALKERRWYMLVYLNLAFIFLNSNKSEMSEAEWAEQLDWYKRSLREADEQSQFEGTVVFLHHPPITNGEKTGDSLAVERELYPAFNEAKKTLFMIAGHTAGYEKFYEQDKYVLVTGGGGAPRADLAGGGSHEDLHHGESRRPFHVLLLQPVQGGVTLEVKGFNPDENIIRQVEKSFIPFR